MGAANGPRVLVCGGWQTVNIGDIAHVPGVLALLERELPGVGVTLWPFKPLTDATVAMLGRRFPSVKILRPTPDPQAGVDDPEVLAAMNDADFCLHGSGPATLAWKHCEAFAAHTGRGFGVYGVTYGLYGIPERATLDRAKFLLFRDSRSLAAARADGVNAPVMGLALDAAFATDVTDDTRGKAFLSAHNLTPGQYLCCNVKLRNTPTWEMPGHNPVADPTKLAANDSSAHALTGPLLEAVIGVVRATDLKVLLCPEDLTQMRISKQYVYDRLPDDVKPHVVWRDTFWLTDEALSVYKMSAGLFGSDMHSPIMCIGHGVPAIVARWHEQSTKGYMWQDIELNQWLFDFDDEEQRRRYPATVVEMARDLPHAKSTAESARKRVLSSQQQTMAVVRDAVRR